ncbi:uncharacterized protein MONBRDRAFT_37587 [Monosiga brevicollis MX1]|uniref:SANT domain-containing protein n=1 Tax=Monosiga brevicollis TaxID=81824 RepID=A9V2N3_MONBE|nr:uncharacterized protein MONBRDRAFT_37587 [Monosiga brevicollis MX1]EDQ88406.1 predicted protein [Monosiga brevicollis MX1]|eukprot:XP_001746999.1 hypothetical protein [Monosiga brevicollis MX1]
MTERPSRWDRPTAAPRPSAEARPGAANPSMGSVNGANVGVGRSRFSLPPPPPPPGQVEAPTAAAAADRRAAALDRGGVGVADPSDFAPMHVPRPPVDKSRALISAMTRHQESSDVSDISDDEDMDEDDREDVTPTGSGDHSGRRVSGDGEEEISADEDGEQDDDHMSISSRTSSHPPAPSEQPDARQNSPAAVAETRPPLLDRRAANGSAGLSRPSPLAIAQAMPTPSAQSTPGRTAAPMPTAQAPTGTAAMSASPMNLDSPKPNHTAPAATPNRKPPKPTVTTPSVPETSRKEYWLNLMQSKDMEATAIEHELTKLQDAVACGSSRKIDAQARLEQTERDLEIDRQNRANGLSTDVAMEDLGSKESMRALITRVYRQNKAAAEAARPVEQRQNAVVENFVAVEPQEYASVKEAQAHYTTFKSRLSRYIYHTQQYDERLKLALARRYQRHKHSWKALMLERFENNRDELLERNKFFETVYPDELRRRGAVQNEIFENLATTLGTPQRTTRAQANNDVQHVDIDNDPNLLTFKGCVTKPQDQLVGYDKYHKGRLIDRNRIVSNSKSMHRELDYVNVWSAEEKQIFFHRFMLHPKRFHRISSHLPNKTTAECVWYYYRHKKELNFKGEREKLRRERSRKAQMSKQRKSSTSLVSAVKEAKETTSTRASKDRANASADESPTAASGEELKGDGDATDAAATDGPENAKGGKGTKSTKSARASESGEGSKTKKPKNVTRKETPKRASTSRIRATKGKDVADPGAPAAEATAETGVPVPATTAEPTPTTTAAQSGQAADASGGTVKPAEKRVKKEKVSKDKVPKEKAPRPVKEKAPRAPKDKTPKDKAPKDKAGDAGADGKAKAAKPRSRAKDRGKEGAEGSAADEKRKSKTGVAGPDAKRSKTVDSTEDAGKSAGATVTAATTAASGQVPAVATPVPGSTVMESTGPTTAAAPNATTAAAMAAAMAAGALPFVMPPGTSVPMSAAGAPYFLSPALSGVRAGQGVYMPSYPQMMVNAVPSAAWPYMCLQMPGSGPVVSSAMRWPGVTSFAPTVSGVSAATSEAQAAQQAQQFALSQQLLQAASMGAVGRSGTMATSAGAPTSTGLVPMSMAMGPGPALSLAQAQAQLQSAARAAAVSTATTQPTSSSGDQS